MGFTLCAAGTLSLNRCNIEAAGFGTADADGNFTGQLTVFSTIPTPNGPIDCAAAPGTCEFAAANTGDYIENGRTPASFGPEVGIESVAVSARVGSARLGVVKVALSGPSSREVRVHYATADGSATGAVGLPGRERRPRVRAGSDVEAHLGRHRRRRDPGPGRGALRRPLRAAGGKPRRLDACDDRRWRVTGPSTTGTTTITTVITTTVGTGIITVTTTVITTTR